MWCIVVFGFLLGYSVFLCAGGRMCVFFVRYEVSGFSPMFSMV